MGYFITISMIIIFTIAGTILMKKDFAIIAPGTFFLFILWLYIWGIFERLEYGVYSLVILAVFTFVMLVIYFTKRKINFKYIFTTGFFVFVFFAVYFYLIHMGRQLWHTDEFSHFGTTVKSMYYLNILSNTAESFTSYKDYPPATALLEYLVMKLGSSYRESDLFRIMSLFSVSLFLPLFQILKIKGKKNMIMLVIIVYLAPTIFNYSYTEILVDCILGLLMAFILITHYTNEDENINYLLLLGLFVLSITKATGVYLALISTIIISADTIYIYRSKVASDLKCVLIKIFMMLAAIMFGKYSWQWSLSREQTADVWNTNAITISGLKEVMHSGVTFINIPISSVIKSFIIDYVYPSDALNLCSLSYLMWIILLFVLSYLIIKPKDKNIVKSRIIILLSGIYIGLFVYSVSLLVCYIFLWGKALTDGSFYRYLNTYYLGSFLCLIYLLLYVHRDKFKKVSIWIIALLLILCRPVEIFKTTLLMPIAVTNVQNSRQIYEIPSNISLIGEDKILIIYNDKGNESEKRHNILVYNLFPSKSKLLSESMIISEEINLKDLIIAEGYTYVWLYSYSDQLDSQYQQLFTSTPINFNKLYKCVNENNMDIKLIAID